MNRYCASVDTKDTDGLLSLFTTDAVANYTRGDLVGHDALRRFFDKFIGTMMEATQHQISNIDIEFDNDDQATATSYVTAWHRFIEPRPDYIVHGRYVDSWRRVDSDWKIANRRIEMMGEVTQPR